MKKKVKQSSSMAVAADSQIRRSRGRPRLSDDLKKKTIRVGVPGSLAVELDREARDRGVTVERLVHDALVEILRRSWAKKSFVS